ncbi:hypothetical protein PSTG_01755 [Puccinia striiformis f. sp. tritici PST-78]|uniref:Protein PBN1 n=1 Tax=Puccinia striiformis f. sp. tritici PST-78 TaxID=1165861 RepID=A0A0L0W0T3_9BASI|nr:hypothetical protein PSTG_01755 [Puccinia striiformis f. sp. tritici PST-78]
MISLRTGISEPVYGFHPALKTTITMGSDEREALAGCAVGLVYAEIPGTVIVDRYQLRVLYDEGRLSEPTGLPMGPLDLLVWTDADLEGPASRPDPPQPGGLMIPLPLHLNHTLSITVPLHFRYLPPIVDSKTLPLQEVFITPPSLAKWCNQTTAARSDPNLTPATIKLLSKTFSAHHLSLEALHAADSHPSTPIRLTVPVGVQDDELLVQIITAAAVWMAFAWICSCLVPKHSSLKLNPRPDTKESSAHQL